jgi:hypothetical protein
MNFKPIYLFSLTACLPLSCASPPMVLAPVGPGPVINGASVPGKGDLQVYSETEEYGDDMAVPFYPHKDYLIYNADGKRLKRVWNHRDIEDEQPAIVTLAAGNYLVKAQAEFYGTVTVPVVIKQNQTTRVILQPGWKPAKSLHRSQLVEIPKGYFVGWHADQ